MTHLVDDFELRVPHPIEVECVTFDTILNKYGIPYYLKIDIEGAEPYCLKHLTPTHLPQYISLEAEELDWLVLLRRLVTLQSISPSPCCIKRTKYISFVANPEGNTYRLIYDPDPLDGEPPVGYLLSKSLLRSPYKTRIGLDGNYIIALG